MMINIEIAVCDNCLSLFGETAEEQRIVIQAILQHSMPQIQQFQAMVTSRSSPPKPKKAAGFVKGERAKDDSMQANSSPQLF